MYSSEQFLKYAKEHLNVDVTADQLNEVRDASPDEMADVLTVFNKRRTRTAVFKWLLERFRSVEPQAGWGIEFVCSNSMQDSTHVRSYRVDDSLKAIERVLGGLTHILFGSREIVFILTSASLLRDAELLIGGYPRVKSTRISLGHVNDRGEYVELNAF